MSELRELINAFTESGGDKRILLNRNMPCLFASGNKILNIRRAEGIDVEALETPSGVTVNIRVKEGVRIENPVLLCIGVLHNQGTQEIKMNISLGRNSSTNFFAHCLFPRAEKVIHIMDAVIEVGEGAEMKYSENHYHGLLGGIEVIPKAVIKVGKGGRYFTDFNITMGRIGKLALDYEVELDEEAVAEVVTRLFGHGNDEIKIKERIVLGGKNSRGLIKTRVALENESSSEVLNIAEGKAEGARGHMDCTEIVKDKATAKA
ncbi:MAG TPA: SufD family Fe-S cluster assembly protein, partial [Thermodesulfobacteriota bacterium]|nr:SufD family Fe-S cluster assembly protein [Thermodesulfobacteriota bacterium]